MERGPTLSLTSPPTARRQSRGTAPQRPMTSCQAAHPEHAARRPSHEHAPRSLRRAATLHPLVIARPPTRPPGPPVTRRPPNCCTNHPGAPRRSPAVRPRPRVELLGTASERKCPLSIVLAQALSLQTSRASQRCSSREITSCYACPLKPLREHHKIHACKQTLYAACASFDALQDTCLDAHVEYFWLQLSTTRIVEDSMPDSKFFACINKTVSHPSARPAPLRLPSTASLSAGSTAAPLGSGRDF